MSFFQLRPPMDMLANPYSLALAGILAAGALYYLFGGGLGRKSREKYSIAFGNQPADASKNLRNYRVGTTLPLVEDYAGHRTCYHALQASIAANGNIQCLGSRKLVKMHVEETEVRGQKRNFTFPQLGPYQWMTYNEFSSKIDALGSAYLATGLVARQNLAIFLETRAEWTIAAQAAFTQNIVVMTCYANLGEEALIHGLNEAEATHIVTSGDLLESIARYVSRGLLPLLKFVFFTEDGSSPEVIAKLTDLGIKPIFFDEALELGKHNLQPHNPPSYDDIAVLMYTSGSTGLPKGVICTHGNVVASIGGVLRGVSLRVGDVHLSYLPLAHILAFVVENGCLCIGCSIAYGSPRSLSEASVRNCKGDIAEASPNFMVGVPTVFDKIKAGILNKVSKAGGATRFLFDLAYKSKKSWNAVGKDTPFWNMLVFRKFKAALGGNVRFIVTGGAPLSKECGEFLKVCFGVPVVQGYALTETTAGGTLGELDDLEGHLSSGPPVCCTELKLVDVPEMGYTHNDKEGPRGEIWIKGPNVSKGYYKNPEKTREEFTEDGWFKTGDIGRLNKNGTFSIVDRKKNLVKPPHGEYIAVERLESSYKNCPLVANILIYASSNFNEVIALIFPNKPNLEEWAKSKQLDLTWPELCASEQARKAVLAALSNTWKETNLRSIERVSAVELFPDEWTPDNGWLTAAMKVQRQQIHKDQKAVINKLYRELGNEVQD